METLDKKSAYFKRFFAFFVAFFELIWYILYVGYMPTRKIYVEVIIMSKNELVEFIAAEADLSKAAAGKADGKYVTEKNLFKAGDVRCTACGRAPAFPALQETASERAVSFGEGTLGAKENGCASSGNLLYFCVYKKHRKCKFSPVKAEAWIGEKGET